jgi:dTDP-4-dehydrorhamnose 3,5-epimerase
MKVTTTPLPGVTIVDLEYLTDDRGFFARTFCQREFAAAGLATDFVQTSISYNRQRATLRGLHYQDDPFQEEKVVRCTRGAVFDVAVDLRTASPTYGQWTSIELTAENRRALYIPTGCAHGFETLVDDTELLYLISQFYQPKLARGIRWDDPAIGVVWPIADPLLSPRDASHPLLKL